MATHGVDPQLILLEVCDPITVGRPGGTGRARRIVRYSGQGRPVWMYLEEFVASQRSTCRKVESNPLSIWRPRWIVGRPMIIWQNMNHSCLNVDHTDRLRTSRPFIA